MADEAVSIGNLATAILARPAEAADTALRVQPSSGVRPALLNREADYDIPARVWSAWLPVDGPRSLRRALSAPERALLQRRTFELQCGLMPFTSVEHDEVRGALHLLVGSYRAWREQGDDADGAVDGLMCVLRELPAWAIGDAYLRIARGEAALIPPIDPRRGPSDEQIHDVATSIVAPYRKALRTAEALLSAPVEQAPQRPPARTPEEQARIDAQVAESRRLLPPKPKFNKHDMGHHERVAAELAVRRMQR